MGVLGALEALGALGALEALDHSPTLLPFRPLRRSLNKSLVTYLTLTYCKVVLCCGHFMSCSTIQREPTAPTISAFRNGAGGTKNNYPRPQTVSFQWRPFFKACKCSPTALLKPPPPPSPRAFRFRHYDPEPVPPSAPQTMCLSALSQARHLTTPFRAFSNGDC